jgi:DHA2 family multidrug resistance protein
MRVRPLVGLFGILIATMTVGFNDGVVSIALADVMGGLGLSRDQATWLPTLYVTGEVVGMSVAPQLGVAFSLRRFALFAIAMSLVPSLLMPFSVNAEMLLALRIWQGLAAGLTIPLLMTTALRVLGPEIRLYGLAAYALSATFAPQLSTTLAALWTDGLDDWRFVFWQALPFCTLAALLVWWGMDQDEPKYELLDRFDWPGMLLVAVGFGSLSVVLEQGDRLDWFNSHMIAVLTLVSALALPALVWRELTAPQPLFKLALLKRRNFAYAALALILFLVIALSASQVPLSFLEQVRGFRPLQAHVLTLEVAASQLVLLPLTAVLLNHRHVDSRWVSAVGYLCIVVACAVNVFAVSDWSREQFYATQLVQSVGFAFVVMPLLMMATNTVKPDEGPFASGMVNTPRAVAEAIGVWGLELIQRWRGGLHRDRILDILGDRRLDVVQAAPIPGATLPVLTPQGQQSVPGALTVLQRAVQAEVTTLTTIDTFAILGLLAIVMLMIVATLPVRTYPPRIALKQH